MSTGLPCAPISSPLIWASFLVSVSASGFKRGWPAAASGLQGRVLGLGGQRLRPVQSEVEMAAAIVEFADLARGRAVEFEDLADGGVERLGEDLRLHVIVGLRQMLERRAKGEKLAERIPAQVALLLKLLHVLGRRAAGAGLQKAA